MKLPTNLILTYNYQKLGWDNKEDALKLKHSGSSEPKKSLSNQKNPEEEKKMEEEFKALSEEYSKLDMIIEDKTKEYYTNEIKNLTIQNLIDKEKEVYAHYANFEEKKAEE